MFFFKVQQNADDYTLQPEESDILQQSEVNSRRKRASRKRAKVKQRFNPI